jgi:hypothetical protein
MLGITENNTTFFFKALIKGLKRRKIERRNGVEPIGKKGWRKWPRAIKIEVIRRSGKGCSSDVEEFQNFLLG